MKLKNLLKESDGLATVLIIFDKLSNNQSFISALNQIKMPTDKYTAIVKFATLLGIPEDKLEAFIQNVKSVQKNEQ
jgi:histone acetyltransferase (RNA polymerase elongator complex component)